MTEEKKIENIIKKYEEFIKSSNVDVAKSTKGQYFFYLVDKVSGDLYSFTQFSTADKLERIILSEVASDLNFVIETTIENLYKEFDNVDISYSTCEFGEAINQLASRIDSIRNEFSSWNKRVEASLNGLSSYINNKEN